MDILLIEKFLISIILGGLMGIERYLSQAHPRERMAGLRTFTLVTLFGTILAHLSQEYPFLIVVGTGAFIFLVIAGYQKVGPDYPGLTTEVGLLVAFLLGVLCYHDAQLAVMLTILVTIILAVKKTAHNLVKKISEEELIDTLKFALIALVILPILPNRTVDPLDVLNPYKIWLLVVFISGIGYIGYCLMKVFGAQSGTGLTGVLGGLVSSTAVTATMSHRSKEVPTILFPALFATTIANSIMFLRIVVEVSVVNAALLGALIFPLGAMMATGMGAAAYFWYKRVPGTIEVDVKDPFNVVPALKFGALFALILVISKVAVSYFGDAGVYAASIFSGLVDVNAITLSMATLAGTEISHKVAVEAIILAAISNVITKTGMAVFFGSQSFRKYMILTSVAVMVVGAVLIVVY
jgi:uncharacterized membrane protein (DUF4010 family)